MKKVLMGLAAAVVLATATTWVNAADNADFGVDVTITVTPVPPKAGDTSSLTLGKTYNVVATVTITDCNIGEATEKLTDLDLSQLRITFDWKGQKDFAVTKSETKNGALSVTSEVTLTPGKVTPGNSTRTQAVDVTLSGSIGVNGNTVPVAPNQGSADSFRFVVVK
jgi:hypothetical protein